MSSFVVKGNINVNGVTVEINIQWKEEKRVSYKHSVSFLSLVAKEETHMQESDRPYI